MSEVKKSVPFVYWANCDDPDYSSVCWHREDALTEINDHGGTLYELSHTSELDRVTAERDAALGREAALIESISEYREREVSLRESLGKARHRLVDVFDVRNALQQRLTAAGDRVYVLTHLLREGLEEYKNGDDWIDRVIAALKPADAQLNQCDGCQAGIPLVNGAHRMGKPGGYPDTMSCTANRYNQ